MKAKTLKIKYMSIALCSAFVSAIFLTGPLTAQTRRALLVGINDYEPNEPLSKKSCRKNWKNLSGCINDVKAIKEVLTTRFHFESRHIYILTDKEATRKRILKGIEKHLIKDTAPADTCVFYYAGHGSQVKNSCSNEPDKMDETLVPADWYKGAHDIKDKELKQLFNRILDKKAHLTVIVDACHSSSISRGISLPLRYRALPSNSCDVAETPANTPAPSLRGALVFSAAHDFQLAVERMDDQGRWHGLFTWALIKILQMAPIDENADNIIMRVHALIQSEGLRAKIRLHDPNLEALRELRGKPLFGTMGKNNKDFRLVVLDVKGNRITLKGGAAHGIRKNCLLRRISSRNDLAPVTVRVTGVPGLDFCQGIITGGNGSEGVIRIVPGDLFEIQKWVVSPATQMRVCIPVSPFSYADLTRIAREVSTLGDNGVLQWVTEPLEENPTHILYWAGAAWYLREGDGKAKEIGRRIDGKTLFRYIKPRANGERKKHRLYMQLPLSTDVKDILVPEITHYDDCVKEMPDCQDAQYILAGRYDKGKLEYAWLMPNINLDEAKEFPLPVKTSWLLLKTSEKVERKAVLETCDNMMKLVKIRAWMQLSSPPGEGDFPYRLALKNSLTGEFKSSGFLMEGDSYGLVLKAEDKTEDRVNPRYIYVFSIDGHGEGRLLFPPHHLGNSENRFPATETLRPEIQMGDDDLFHIGPPFGSDTLFLLSSEEPITQPGVLSFEGVQRTPSNGESYNSLERLLYGLGSGYRGEVPATGANWSIQRLSFVSIPQK